MPKTIDHIGIAVKSIERALRVYRDGLGLALDRIEDVPEQGTRVAMLPVGASRIELLEAMGEGSPVARFIAKRGEGLHHICLLVRDVQAELDRLKSAGFRLIDERPRLGADGRWVAFVHPSCAGGVLIELSQSAERP